jgi:hypothetical protein
MIRRRQRGAVPWTTAWAVAAVIVGLGLGAILGSGAGGAYAAAPAKTGTSGSKGSATKGAPAAEKSDPGDSDTARYEVFLLPTDWRNTDGTINEAAILAQEKKRLDVINKALKVNLQMSETTHYLIFSCASDETTRNFEKWSENLYANLCRQFQIQPTERLWNGKCLLMLFETRDQYARYAKEFDHSRQNMDKTAGYFLWECREVPGTDSKTLPQLVHISIPTEKQIPQMLQDVFAHEATHAFFEMYRKPGRLPLWLHEGVAVYMEVVNEPLMRGYQLKLAKDFLASNKPTKPLFEDSLDTLEEGQYGVSYTLVEQLLSQPQGGAKFKQFIIKLKDGEKVDPAMKAAFGFDTSGLDKMWHDAMSKIKLTTKKA